MLSWDCLIGSRSSLQSSGAWCLAWSSRSALSDNSACPCHCRRMQPPTGRRSSNWSTGDRLSRVAGCNAVADRFCVGASWSPDQGQISGAPDPVARDTWAQVSFNVGSQSLNGATVPIYAMSSFQSSPCKSRAADGVKQRLDVRKISSRLRLIR
ncbi:uncharacterized protein F5Z01DRAFT_343917 [Emericellopsis atlantica]|uniref:Uncharacterized protein n=1 Tax=Emericellopsis atlantica TaxID=2614577 RepID=A0A9P8CKM0_9HYPO|nr:uncharacterized protein F5Z01DRAFT_343917 [Emericellopsis atlantica]KAG9250709.1 hypothetical protein F5Z01DRAFT_343917 [Emericellopsis atlantica]